MKKGLVLLLACMMVLLLSACESGEHISLTEDESNAIAQYSAYLIMKYDARKTHKEKLLDEKELKQAYADRAAEEEKNNPTPTPSATPVPEVKRPDTDVKVPDTEQPAEPTPTPEPKPTFDSLSECFDNKFKVSYLKTTIGTSYQSDYEFFSVNAPEGQKLVVTEFSISNDSSQDQTFALKNFAVSFKLVSDRKSYNPKLSLIANDLLLLEKKLTPNENTNGVLLFFIDDGEKAEKLVVTNPDISLDKNFEITINN